MDYRNEPKGVFFLIDSKSFYASVEAVERYLNPLEVLLVVMSEQENTNGGLILATSPAAKKRFGLKANVSRQRDLPQDPNLIVVPPRMNLYIKRNLQINDLYRHFVADEDLWPYSIDESILDLTHSWRLFGQSVREVARKIQVLIKDKFGLYTTVGIGDNPVQAKLALDLYAKHQPDLIGEIHYETVPKMLWQGTFDLTDVWSIGQRTAVHLAKLHIYSLDDLAHSDPYALKAAMGVIGLQLFALAWGIDRTQLADRPAVKESSLGNSQVLPRDYSQKNEIELVIREIGAQVASRLRHHHKEAGQISLGIGFSFAASQTDGRDGFTRSMRIDPTDETKTIVAVLLRLFEQEWQQQTIRNIAVYTGRLRPKAGDQLNFFQPFERQLKDKAVDHVVDFIHQEFGLTALVYASSLMKGGTAIERANLVGGHNGGNSYE